MSLARQHRAYHEALRSAAAAPVAAGGLAVAGGSEAQLAAARLLADRRRLKEIQSVERKIEAKRAMVPEYAGFLEAQLKASVESGTAAAGEVLPTIMVWSIDIGDYRQALGLAGHVLAHDVAMPAHFKRTAPCLIAEEIADAALKAIGLGADFDLEVLLDTEQLLTEQDMPDEVQAKLQKVIGLELARRAELLADEQDPDTIAGGRRAHRERARVALARALALDARVGVKKDIERLDRALKPVSGATASAGQALAPRRSAAADQAEQAKGPHLRRRPASPPKTGERTAR